jgi:hypothetical protein
MLRKDTKSPDKSPNKSMDFCPPQFTKIGLRCSQVAQGQSCYLRGRHNLSLDNSDSKGFTYELKPNMSLLATSSFSGVSLLH